MSPSKLQTIAVLGAGGWGTTLAIHLSNKGYSIRLWDYYPETVALLNRTRRNPLLAGIAIPSDIQISNDIELVVKDAGLVCLAVPSHAMRALLQDAAPFISSEALIVNLSKGIEQNSLLRMSQLIEQVLQRSPDSIITLHGPSHAEEVSRQVPTAVVAASLNLQSAKKVQQIFMTEALRVYTSDDIIGVELGGSVKNIIAIAAGICDGMGFGDNAKAALLTRGNFEMVRMGLYLGGREETFAGLSGIGDLIVTCYSKHSRNRYVGEEIAKGRKLQDILDGMTMIAEGVNTTRTVYQMSRKYGIEMPICNQIYTVLFEDRNPREAVRQLMSREPVQERHSLPDTE